MLKSNFHFISTGKQAIYEVCWSIDSGLLLTAFHFLAQNKKSKKSLASYRAIVIEPFVIESGNAVGKEANLRRQMHSP